MKRYFVLHLFILAGFALFLACGNQTSDEAGMFQLSSIPPIPAGGANFNFLYAYVIQPRCERCHPEFATESNVLGWIVPGHPDQSEFFTIVQSGQMPKGGPPISPGQPGMPGPLEVIQSYIQNVNPAKVQKKSPPGKVEANFDSIYKNVLEPSCMQCHSDKTATAKRPALQTMEEFKQNCDDALDDMRSGDMPPEKFKGPRPTQQAIDAVEKWMNSGYPEHANTPAPIQAPPQKQSQ